MMVPAENVVDADGADAQKPCHDYGSKQEANPVGAVMLKWKQANQYDTSNWDFDICKVSWKLF